MFTYLRYFSAISSLIIVLVAFMLGYYFRTLAEDDLEQLVQRNNRALAQGFINSTWKTHWSVLDQLYTIDPAQWRNYREFVEFSKDVFHYFEEIPTAKVNLYTKNGVRILSTDQSEILLTASDASPSLKESFAAAKAGNVRNSVLENVEFSSASGEKKRGTLVQTLVPILSDNYVSIVEGSESTKTETLQGIVEVYYDITPQWQHLKRFQIIGTGGIIGIFMVLIGLLIATSKKAEAIIGRQHEANVELAAQAAAAQAENQNKSQFLANISHELRTPLNAIIGFSEIIKNEVMGTLENTQYQDYIRDIHSSGVHLLSLINDILDYSKAEAGKLELDITEVDATKIIQNSMRLVSPRAEAAEVKLIDAVPREHFVTLTDAKKLKQIMLNLLSNAVKFTPPGGEVSVTAWPNTDGNVISIQVKDSGIGIAPKDISRAMSPFGQVDSTLSRKYEGTGLGLPLTKKFVELLGGQFTIHSTVNVGTTITFTLPVKLPAPETAVEG